MKKVKTKSDLQNHPYVSSLHKENDDGSNSSWWLYLKDGYKSVEMECGMIHEPTIKEICDVFNAGVVEK